MTDIQEFAVTRRNVLKGGGALVVSMSVPASLTPGVSKARASSALTRPLSPALLDTYIAIGADDSVTAYFGKMDMGQGLDVAIGQIVAEELDVPFERVTVVMGDTALTVDQGGGSASSGIQRGAKPLRSAAAEARRILFELAAKRFKVPVSRLQAADGVIAVTGDSSKTASYGKLIGGRHFNVTLKWNGKYGNRLDARGKAKPKPVAEYRLVGTSVPRNDVPGKVFAETEFVTDVKVPGMVHGRVIRPPQAGSVPATVDESSVRSIPGVRVVHLKDFLGVVADTEWHAIRAAEALKVTWSKPTGPAYPSMDALYDHIREAPVMRASAGSGFRPTVKFDDGPVRKAIAAAPRVIKAEYEWPFQSHASMGPACAVVDARGDEATVWTGSQKPHQTRTGVARILGLKQDKVRGIWVIGPGSYGRNDAGDGAMDAALLSRAVGRPVRVQGMRFEGHGWDPKAPASVSFATAGLDEAGNVIAYHFRTKGFSAGDMASGERNPSDTYAGMLIGFPNATVHRLGNPAESYGFPNKIKFWEVIPPLLEKASPLRTAHFRDPLGPQLHFASESFIDELAFAVDADPVAFRLRYLKKARDKAVIRAAAEKVGWKTRPSGRNVPKGDGVVQGRGIAYAQRNGAVVAIVAEVEVDRRTGRVWPRRYVAAVEHGLVVNPEGLRLATEGNIVQATSRALFEEVQFDGRNVTSIDWESYPIIETPDIPESIEVVVINRKDLAPRGAGEPSTRPVAAAIANAIFDATGVRLRRAPFSPKNVKAALG
jgi:CO/xanthine dehydrogenase Mo-binding subunit